jgi:hypothetical protein
VTYVADKLRAAGYQVRLQSFPFPFFQETGDPVFARTSPSPRTFTAGTDFGTGTYSGDGDVTGRLVPTNDIVIPPTATLLDERLRADRLPGGALGPRRSP